MTHTPGPWIAGWSGAPDAEGMDQAGPITVVSVGRGGVAECRPLPTGHASTWPIVQANARLIAAAPELLAVLKAVELSARTDSDTCAICQQDLLRHASGCVLLTVQTAIAKAEGRADA